MAGKTLRFQHPVSGPGAVTLRFGDAVAAPDYLDATLSASLPPAELPGLTLLASGNSITSGTLAASLPAAELPGLVLVATGDVPGAPVLGTLAAVLPPAELPGLTLHALDGTVTLALAAALPPAELPVLSLAGQGDQDLALPEAAGCRAGLPIQHGQPDGALLSITQQAMRPASLRLAAHQHQAQPLARPAGLRQHAMIPTRSHLGATWQQAKPLARASRAGHADTQRTHHRLGTPWQQAATLGIAARAGHAETIRLRRFTATRWQQAIPMGRTIPSGHHHGHPVAVLRGTPWQQGIYPPPGFWLPPSPPWQPTPGKNILRFCHLSTGPHSPAVLVFGCRNHSGPPAGRIIPIRSVYLVLNNVLLTRLPDGLPLPALDLSLSIDADSWSWGWSATLPAEYLDDLMPAPDHVEVQATVNGEAFHLRVERITRTRQFGKARIQIGSRGRAAELADPNAPAMQYGNPDDALTAQQLAIAAITAPGIPLGWDIDWQLEDWLVPQGVWSHQGTPISAVQRIAEAAGGYVQADPVAKILHLLHRYPVKPWEWAAATPDVEIPVAVTVTEDIEWSDKPNYTRVYVSGQGGGILGQVTRSGTAGDVLAPLVTDPLITHPYAARQRGLTILADTGRQALQTLSLPVLPESGIILPGQLVRFTEPGQPHRVGLVRGTSLNYSRPKLRQTLQVETHGN